MIILLQHSNHHYTLWQLDASQQIINTLELDTLSDFPDELKSQKLIILLDGTILQLTSVTLPKMSYAELRQAVPFALEETLSEPIDQLHFFIGPKIDNERSVAIINKLQWQAFLDQLSLHSLSADVITPDFLALKHVDETWTILIDADHASVRLSQYQGFSIDIDNLAMLLSLKLAEQSHPNSIQLYCEDSQFDASKLQQLGTPVELVTQPLQQSIDIDNLVKDPSFNLLQGPYQTNKKKSAERNYWRWCVGSVIAFIIIIFCGEIALFSYYKYTAHKVDQQINQAYQQIFPGTKADAESRQMINATLKHYSIGTNTFLNLASRTGKILANNRNIQPQTLNFAASKLTLTLTTDQRSSLNQFVKDLTQSGLSVRQDQSQATKKKITVKLTIG